MWRWIDNAEYGALNALLTQTGVLHSYQPFLSDSDLAMWMVIIADVWKLTPSVAILLLAGLQSIDREVVDVARVEGAGRWKVVRHMLLPRASPAILMRLVRRTTEALQVCDLLR